VKVELFRKAYTDFTLASAVNSAHEMGLIIEGMYFILQLGIVLYFKVRMKNETACIGSRFLSVSFPKVVEAL
jgi:hypothetical protein